MLKNKFSGLNSVNIIRFNLAVVASQICEILRKYELIAAQKVIQGHRSWCKWKAHMQLPISYYCNFGRVSYVFEILTHLART